MARKRGSRLRHIPQRSCVACGEKKDKRELVRIVRTASGTAEADPTGKRMGRGAYLCKSQPCWENGCREDRLERVLRMKITPENREQLLEYGGRFATVRREGLNQWKEKLDEHERDEGEKQQVQR